MTEGKIEYLPLEECEERRLYRLRSNNLTYGVYRLKSDGFLGVRTKFDIRHVDEEYHWDTGGTAFPLEALDIVLPPEIKLECYVGYKPDPDHPDKRLAVPNAPLMQWLDLNKPKLPDRE